MVAQRKPRRNIGTKPNHQNPKMQNNGGSRFSPLENLAGEDSGKMSESRAGPPRVQAQCQTHLTQNGRAFLGEAQVRYYQIQGPSRYHKSSTYNWST
ncbi:hypothetical protein CCACVL1_02522 [Corchorus capsularis]|uniref:Uncharacterized protein n=1 Tax=Corchorus capsularis TaxID=210143 RepID=A0A1R3K7W6_COCAP|nr:hypothetical protein CCACVL1_02522 [Corchorus capsularis]